MTFFILPYSQITGPVFILSQQDASPCFWQSPFPALFFMSTTLSRLPLSSHLHTSSPIIKHNIILLSADCIPAAISDNCHQLSQHICKPFTPITSFSYTALPAWEEFSVKIYITLPLCTFRISPGAFLFHTVCKKTMSLQVLHAQWPVTSYYFSPGPWMLFCGFFSLWL